MVGVVVEVVVVRHAEVIGFWRHLNGSESCDAEWGGTAVRNRRTRADGGQQQIEKEGKKE